MDRWGDADDDMRSKKQTGRVARLGMGGFVKSQGQAMGAFVQSEGMTSSTGQPSITGGQIEVVESKKEQKERAASALAAAMPPPQSRPQQRPVAPAPPPCPSLPEWVGGEVPDGACLIVMKGDLKIEQVRLSKAATLFGRLDIADVVMEHASISRWHAAVCVKKGTSRLYVIDFGSAHGTFLNDIRVAKGCPVELTAQATLRFGASTRKYVFELCPEQHTKRSLQESDAVEIQKAKKKSRVRFGDEEGDEGALTEVIGYSDGSSFTPLVGPKAAESGQFADLLPSTSASSVPQDRKAEAADDTTVKDGAVKVKPELQAFIQNIRTKSTNLYDGL